MTALFDQQVTFLFTPDLARTASFYEDIVGLELVLDQGSCRIYRTSGTSFLGFCERGERVAADTLIVTLVTENVEQFYHTLYSRGVQFTKPPSKNDTYNIFHTFFRDPNGYLLEIQQFLDPRWPR